MSSSSSPIDRHKYILLLSITSASVGQWFREPSDAGQRATMRREADLAARVDEVLKSPSDQGIPRELRLKVVQREPVDGFRSEDYGPWSEIDLATGIELLVFANEHQPDDPIERALANGCGLLVRVPSAQAPFAVEDVRRALGWKRAVGPELLSSERIRNSINAEKASSGPLLAGYLTGSLEGRPLTHPAAVEGHKFLLGLLKAREANSRFRQVILAHEVAQLTMADSPPAWFRIQLVAAMAGILTEREAAALQDPIRQAYIMNSIFDAGGRELVSADDVFTANEDRVAFESAVRKVGFPPEQQARLRRWAEE